MGVVIYTKRQDEVRVTNCCAPKPYLELQLPGDAARIERITVTLSSRDQGFCDDQSMVGHGGYTWFELNIETNGGRNNIPRRCFYRNPAGIPAWSESRSVLDCTQEHDELWNYATAIKPYDVIQLIPRAQFSGWTNFLRKAKLKIEYSTHQLQPSDKSKSVFKYQGLDKGDKKSTRLLDLRPGELSDPIVVALKTCIMGQEEGPDPPYEALSYCWGEPDSSSNGLLHVLDEAGSTSVAYVSHNLFQALLQLRHTTTNRLLWVDQVCINQADQQELSEQVGIMSTIYSQAERVIIWLGDGDPEVERSIDVVNSVFPHYQQPTVEELRLGTSRGHLPNVDVHNLPVAEVTVLLSLPWFWRVWVVQEAVRAAERTFMYGQRTLDWDTIQKANLWTILDGFEMPGKQHIVLPYIWSSMKVEDQLPGDPSVDVISSSRHDRWSLGLDLFTMFIRGLDLRASDPRDHIFGLFGLCSELSETCMSPLIVPDYSKSVSAAFIDFTLRYIEHDLRVLSVIHALKGRTWRALGAEHTPFRPTSLPGRPHEYPPASHPTWALWHNGTTEWANEALGLSDMYHVTGDSKLRKPAYHDNDRTRLTLSGHCLGRLISIGPYRIPSDSATDISVAYTRIFNKLTKRAFRTVSGHADPHAGSHAPQDPAMHWYAHYGETGLPESLPCANDCYFQATNGLAGLCPAGTMSGDVVVILYGGSVPYLLRDTDVSGEYTFVGECFLEGKMDQNLLAPFEEAGTEPGDFVLV
ncbi:heterokaryon incompatibility protein-domain-containing protein [Boeremia exigua]|uniref:heterokaryon incompatibility protein-domain-containing protein n=1 Tax=Boeremia exigua TaxID=749465 RepID=UPI001E8D4F6C|nr:heterokaryon incompatibility protein-domain-containing protein [Boeremia exigua]KAH6612159.1 heterokaryon incompatibility protein-domain-containing protein [Boeremia exigua]